MQTETLQSAARFRAVFENAGIGIAIADKSGRLLETNAAVQNMLGYSAEELRGKHYAEVTHPDDLEREIALSQPLLDGTSSGLQLEKRYIHRDGHVMWGRMTLTVVNDSTNDQDFAVVMVEDITARKQFENALQHREEELRAVFQSTLDGVVILEPDAVIVDANSAACELMHCQKDELVGRCVKDFLQVPDFRNGVAALPPEGALSGAIPAGRGLAQNGGNLRRGDDQRPLRGPAARPHRAANPGGTASPIAENGSHWPLRRRHRS